MDCEPHPNTPFDRAWQYIADNSGSAAEALAKLYLSFWDNDNFPFTIRECVAPLDSERRAIAREMIAYYFEHGAGERVCRNAYNIIAKYARLRGKRVVRRVKTESDASRHGEMDVADMLWKLKRISLNLGRAIANHDYDDAHAEAGRLVDTVEHYERNHPQKTI